MKSNGIGSDIAGGTICLNDFFTKPGEWWMYCLESTRKIDAYGAKFYLNPKNRLGTAVIFRGVHERWKLKPAVLTFISERVRDGTFTAGYVILAEDSRAPKEVIAFKQIEEVAALMDGVPCCNGKWWIDREFAARS
jgi:hypothetical protein